MTNNILKSYMALSSNMIKSSMLIQHFFGIQGTVVYELQEKSLNLLIGTSKTKSFVGMLNMTAKTYGFEKVSGE